MLYRWEVTRSTVSLCFLPLSVRMCRQRVTKVSAPLGQFSTNSSSSGEFIPIPRICGKIAKIACRYNTTQKEQSLNWVKWSLLIILLNFMWAWPETTVFTSQNMTCHHTLETAAVLTCLFTLLHLSALLYPLLWSNWFKTHKKIDQSLVQCPEFVLSRFCNVRLSRHQITTSVIHTETCCENKQFV